MELISSDHCIGGRSRSLLFCVFARRGPWLQREVGLLSSLSLTVGRQIVGLSSGYIRAYSRTRNRKQVIVLVNEGQS